MIDTFKCCFCTNILDVDFKKIREFSGTYDDWYIASTSICKAATNRCK